MMLARYIFTEKCQAYAEYGDANVPVYSRQSLQRQDDTMIAFSAYLASWA